VEAQKSLDALHLSGELLEHSVEDLKTWGYFIDIPPGPGGDQPSHEGKIAKCERCTQYFLVKSDENQETCIYHWGKAYTSRVEGGLQKNLLRKVKALKFLLFFQGQKVRTYTCCSRPVADGEGCSHGPHVFYESKAEELHSRHPFSFLSPPELNRPKLDVIALDCEMIYTTGGMRVARVSIVDGSGKEILDEFIKMDEGVRVMYADDIFPSDMYN